MPTFKGGCQCGAVRYTLNVERFVIYACHCLECQKQSASAFGLSVPIQLADLDISGALRAYERDTASGGRTACWFCPACGSRLYHQPKAAPDRATLKGGTLDDTSALKVAGHLWVCRKQPWVKLDPSAPAYDTQPTDLSVWRQQLSAGG